MERFRLKLLLSLLAVFMATQLSYAQLSGYSERLKGVVNSSQVSGSTDLTNFPVLMSFTVPRLRHTSSGGEVQNINGYDIVFTTGNGSTIMSHQIETYDPTTGQIEFWVRFPTLSATTDTPFYIYFGNPSVSTDPSSTNVWDSNYKMVLHMNGDTNDASGVGTDATDSGTTDVAGQIGRAREYGNNQGDVIFVPDNGVSPLDITGNITISFWVNISNLNEGPDFVTKGDYTDGYSTWVTGGGGNARGRLVYQINNDALQGSATGQIANGTWSYLTFTRSPTERSIYIDGVLDVFDNSTASFNTNDDPLYISTPAYDFEGIMDEVRISDVTRSADWIATEYNNQSNPLGFVSQVNAEPILDNIEASAITYNSGDPATAVTSAITVYDGDDVDIESATVQITGNYISTEDVLAFTDQNGITGSWDSGTGTLTLTGTSSEANYQTALRSVTYQNTNAAPSELTRTISFTINDGDDDSNTETRNINVVKVNIAPTLSNIESNSIVYFAGNGDKIISNTLNLSDPDDTNLTGATVEISANYLSGEDTLKFVDQNGITGSWNDGSGILTLSGTTTVANYKAALRSVVYENSSGSPSMSTRTISITASDDTEAGNTVTRNIEFPAGITELATYKSNGVFHFDAQDADGDGNSGTNQPANGALTTWADRSDDVGGSTVDLSFTANAGTEEALLNASYFGNRSGLLFDGTDDYYERTADDPILNTGTFTEKSFAFVIRTGASTSGFQVFYEQGGGTRGYNFSVFDGVLYAHAYNRSGGSAWGAPDGGHRALNLGMVEPNTSYIIIANHDNTTWEASVNGGSVVQVTNANTMTSHTGNAAIGASDGNTRDPITFSNTSGVPFDGFMGELVSWNSALTSTDFTNIFGFLSDKWFNEAPVVSGIELSDISYSEGDPATQITNTITVSDADDTNLDSAKVYISSGFDASEDVLAFTNQLGITGSYNSSTGVLLLTGSSSVANYQTALRAVTYENTDAVSPSTTSREIIFEVYDWDDMSNTVVRGINIVPSNTAPDLASIEGTTLAYTETDGQVAITSTITASDTDNSNFTGATVRFSNNYFLGEDFLNFTNANGITGSFNSSTGVLSLSGSSSVANYQAALRSVTYENTSEDPVTGLDRTVEFRVFDGIDSSGVQTRDISVASINTAPTLANTESVTIFYSAGDSVIVTDETTISDPDDVNIETVDFQITGNYNSNEDTLTFNPVFGITSSWNDGSGTLTLTGPASKMDFESAIQTVRYKNTAGTPTDIPRTISITANDGDDNSNTVTRTISFSIPASVSDLLVWLKGDAGTFTTTGGSTPSTEGSNVGRWEDQSGNGHHFTATTGTPPVFRTSVGTINSQNAVEFPGGGTISRLEDGDAETQYLNGLDELTIFFVLEADAAGTDRGFWTTYQPDGTGTDQYFSMRYDATGDNGGASNVITTGMRDLSPEFVMESFENAQSTNGQIVMLKWRSENTYDLYVDGVLSNPTYSTNIPSGLLSNLTTAILGQGTQDQTNSWDGLIAEVILYGKELNTTEQEEIENYLSNKYSIAIRSLTPATGGEAISADSAAVVGGGYLTLTGPRIQESFVGEFSGGGTFVFQAPAGYEWDTGGTAPSATVNPAFGGSTDLTINFTSRTSTQVTYTVSSASTTNPAEVIFTNLRVKPTTGVLPNTGNITNVGTTGLGGTTNYGTLTMVPGTQIAMEYLQQPSTSNVSAAITPFPRIQLVDQFGNAVEESGVTVSMSLNQVSGSGNLSGTTNVPTNLFGIAEFSNLQVDDTGTYTLTASSTGLSSEISDQFDIVVLGQLTQFLVERVPSGNIANKTAGQNFNITIIAVDGAADTVDTFTGTVSLTSNCTMGTGQGTTPAFTGGVLASRTVSITNTGTCSITATNSAGPETGTSNTFTVNPGAPSAATTTISASPTVIFNDGFSTSTITVQVKDAEGNNVTSGGQTVALSVTDGSLSGVTDHGDGTYTATLTSSVIAGVATITGTLNGNAITDNATVEYAEFNTQWQSQVGPVVDAQNWDDPANWSAGIVPGPTDKVLIPANPSVGNEQPVIETTNTTVAQISIENSASVTVSGGINFVVTGEVSGEGEITGSNTDTLTVGGDLDIDATIGYIILDGSSTQAVSAPNDFSNLELDNPAGATFDEDVTVSDSLKFTNGELFIPSGKNLIANAQSYDSGSLRMQRRISGSRGWRIISSPVNTTYGDLLDGVLTQGYNGATYSTGSNPGDTLQPNVLTYLESAPGTDNQRYRAPTSAAQSVSQGQGIFIFIFGDIPVDPLYNDPIPDTLDVTGQEWDGNGTEVDFGVTYTVTADSGWNLVGNPFAATIDWDDNTNWTKTNIDPTIYIWDPSANGGDGEYLTWNGVTGTLPGGLIAPFQGFWVKANAASPVLRVNKDAKTTAGTFLRKESESNQKEAGPSDPQIQLMVRSDAGRSKRTNIMFSDDAAENKDALDAFRLLPLSNSHIELHTLLDDGTELAINNLPLSFNSRVKIPLHIDAFEDGLPYSGEFEITWPGLRNIPSDWIITLIDNETGEEVDISASNSYTFSHTTRNKISKAKTSSMNAKIRKKAASTDTRFTLEISTEYIEANVPEEVYLSQNYPNPFNPETTIPFGLDEDANVELVVYDVLGRKVRTLISGRRTAGNYEIPFKALDLASGVYFYRLITDKGTFIKKFTLIK